MSRDHNTGSSGLGLPTSNYGASPRPAGDNLQTTRHPRLAGRPPGRRSDATNHNRLDDPELLVLCPRSALY